MVCRRSFLLSLNIVLFVYVLQLLATESPVLPDEQRLLDKLFRTYDNSVRPVYNSTRNVEVAFGINLIQIMDMDEKNQVLVTNVWLEHEWVDERIGWFPEEYGGLKIIRIPSSKLWLPDIVLYNNADDFTNGYMLSNAMVHSNGRIFWSPPARLRSSCKVDTTYFPFDEQTCYLKFGSWTYDQAQVDLVNKSNAVDISNYISNGEWQLLKARIRRNEVIYPISPAVYPDITVSFVIKRRILYYIINIIFPCVWLNILSLLAFCLPPDAGEKITLGITVLLSYSVFMLLVAENMPPTSEFVPLVGIYITVSMAVTSISVILTVAVLKLHHCGPKQRPVPDWVRAFVLYRLARLLGCKCDTTCCYPDRKRKPKRPRNENADVCLRLMNESRTSPVAELRRIRQKNVDIPNGDAMKRIGLLEDILKYLQILVAKRDEDDEEEDLINEWQAVAHVCDKLLFILFLTCTILITLLLMIFIPLMQNIKNRRPDDLYL